MTLISGRRSVAASIDTRMTDTTPIALVRIYAVQCRLPLWHFLPARQRCRGRALHLLCDLDLYFLESLCADALLFQVLLIQADRIALAPFGKELGRKRFPSFALVVRGMAAHPERFRDQQRRPIAGTTPLGGDSCGCVRVEHVIAVEGGSPDSVARGPILEVGGQMVLRETRAQGDLIVRDDENRGDALYGREVRAFV